MTDSITYPFTITIGSESWTYTTSCGCCHRPIRWATLSDGDQAWVDDCYRTGCPEPSQPNEGPFPHNPIDDSAQWEH